MGMLTDITKIVLGDRENRKQSVVVIPAQNVANSPGVLGLQTVSGTTVTTYYIWPNTSGVLRYGSTFPTSIDSDGAAVGAAASVTLDQAYDNGATINGAISSGTAIKLGGAGASDNVSIYHDATDLTFAVNTGDLKITTQGGDVDFADENLTTTGYIQTSSYVKTGTAVNNGVQFNGTTVQIYNNAGAMTFVDTDYGTISLKTLAGGALNNPTVTGDLTITDGKIVWTDAVNEVAGAWTFSNVANDGIDLVMASLTTANGIHVVADALTNGNLINLQSSAAGWGTGTFLNATHDGSASVFSVGQNGAVTIAGTASGTAALTLTLGDIVVSAGQITADNAADVVAYDFARNHATSTNPVFHIHQDHTGSTGAVLELVNDATGNAYGATIASAGDYAQLYISAPAARTGPVIEIPMANQTDQRALYVTGAWVGANGYGAIDINSSGVLAAGASLINLTSTGANTAASYLLNISHSTGAFTNSTNGLCIRSVDSGAVAGTSYNTYISSTANNGAYIYTGATGKTALTLDAVQATTASILSVVGGTGTGWVGATGVGCVNIAGDGTLAHANASMLNIAFSGTSAASSLGSCLRIIDTATSGGGTGYAAYLSSTNDNGVSIVTAAAAKTGLTITGPASQTASQVIVDGTTGSWIGAATTGMVHLTSDGAVVADGSLLRIASTGQPAAANDGVCIEVVESGAAQATSYAVRIASTNNEALHVDTGLAVFDEGPLVQYAAGSATDNAPTSAELNTRFGITVAAAYNGFIGVLEDSDHAGDDYVCFVADGAWFYLKGTAAV